MPEVVIAVVAAIAGAVVGAGAAWALALLNDRRRDQQLKMDDQRAAARAVFKCAYDAKQWLSNLRNWGADIDARRERIRKDAMERKNNCGLEWDIHLNQVDSSDVKAKMTQVNSELQVALLRVVEGNLTPDTASLTQALHELKETSNRVLNARI
jgi:hypothetical protein